MEVWEMNEEPRQQKNIGLGILLVLIGVVLGVALATGLFYVIVQKKAAAPAETTAAVPETTAPTGTEEDKSLYERFDHAKMQEIMDLLEERYLYDIDEEKLEDAVFHALLSSIGDRYACYYDEEELLELYDSNDGTYYGIGVMVSQNLETMESTVTHVFRDSPALESGMKNGDILKTVAGQDVSQMELDDIVTLIKGEEGSTIYIEVARAGEDAFIGMDVERRRVEQDMVYWEMIDEEIGYIEILQFTNNAPVQLSQALSELSAQGMKGLVLDLRGNPGGLLSSVISVGDQLLPGGTLLTIKSRYEADRVYKCKNSGFDIPMVVLVDENSASAAEVLTGAIKDYGVGTIVGVTTFGKGIVQDIYVLGNDETTGMKFTTADYYTPNGNNIHGTGIEPDVVVELGTEYDNQLETAVDVLKEKMK